MSCHIIQPQKCLHLIPSWKIRTILAGCKVHCAAALASFLFRQMEVVEIPLITCDDHKVITSRMPSCGKSACSRPGPTKQMASVFLFQGEETQPLKEAEAEGFLPRRQAEASVSGKPN